MAISGACNPADLVRVATGGKTADLVVKNAQLVNVYSGSYDLVDIAIHDGFIAGVGKYDGLVELEANKSFAVPGFVDSHSRVESSLLTPETLSLLLLQRGTTTVIAEPRAIANVSGITGIDYLLEASAASATSFLFKAPACVPSTSRFLETTGAVIDAKGISTLLKNDVFTALGAVTDIKGLLGGDTAVFDKINAAATAGKVIDGYTPELTGTALAGYFAAGPESNHQSTKLEEFKEKLKLGAFLKLRDSSSEANLIAGTKVLDYFNDRNFALVTDTKTAADFVNEGGMDHLIRRAVGEGVDPRIAVRMATVNPSSHYGLRDRGVVAPGKVADIVLLEDLTQVYIKTVIKGGRVVYEEGLLRIDDEPISVPGLLLDSVKTKPISADFLERRISSGKCRVVSVTPGEAGTKVYLADPPARDNALTSDTGRDLLKLAVLNRYQAEPAGSVGLVRGFGLRTGALASSVSRDANNLVAVGVEDEDIAAALNEVIRMRGGLAVSRQGRPIATLPLPIAGLMSELSAAQTGAKLEELTRHVTDMGAELTDPFTALSLLSLVSKPDIRMTDRGLVDAPEQKLLEFFV